MLDPEQFRDRLQNLRLADKTATAYVQKALSAESWLRLHGSSLDQASPHDIMGWVGTLASSHSTLRQARNALRHYYAWVGRESPPISSIRVPPKPRYFCRAVTEAEARALKAAAIGWHPHGTVVLIGLYLALRAKEIAQVRWDRFDRELTHYTVQGKGGYVDTLPVHPQLRAELAPLTTAYPYLFPGSRGRAHVTEATIWGWVREVGEAAGLNRPIQTHQLRHTAGATMHDATKDLRTTSLFLRHRRLETTMIYTRTTEAQLWAAVTALDYG